MSPQLADKNARATASRNFTGLRPPGIARAILILLAFVGFTLRSALAAPKVASPLSPEQALAAFETEAGLKVSLVAAEPLIDSPCALAFDESGRLFVAENRGYPLGGPNGESAGRITVLEDSDGDGRMDRRTEFANGLTFPNGLMPWRGGIIVTCAPEVLYYKDTDDDGKADLREVLLTGFATNTTTQLRVNAPLLGTDGWVYLASGLSGGSITSPKRRQQPAHELKGDLRFRPDTGEFEGIDGRTQFGQSFDDFGRRFGCFNRVQVQHFVLNSRYLARSPAAAATGVLQNCPDLVDNPLMRGGGGAARIFPISENVTTADSHAGYFTAACAIHVFRGDGLPAGYRGHAFSADPTGNLVHHDRLDPVGATFAARRVHEGVEFLRSPDGWFRPVFLISGPDGALYVADMYRGTIEHPEYVPAEVRKRTNFDEGKGRGRIWKVNAEPANVRTETRVKLASATTEEVVSALGSADGWQRDTAARLLLERNDRGSVPRLRQAAASAAEPLTLGLVLRLLETVGELDPVTLAAGLGSADAGVREIAVQLAESRVGSAPALKEAILQRVADRDARVRFTSVLAMGAWLAAPAKAAPAPVPGLPAPVDSKAPAISALATMASRDGADRWARTAVLSAATGVERELTRALLARGVPDSEGLDSLLAELGRALAVKPSSDHAGILLDLMRGDLSARRGISLLGGYGDGVSAARAETSTATEPTLIRALSPNTNALELLGLLRVRAERMAVNLRETPSGRARAINFLGHTLEASAGAVLLRHLGGSEPLEVQIAALRAMTRSASPDTAKELLARDRWRSFPPGIRSAILEGLLSRSTFHPPLLDAIEAGVVQPGLVPTARRKELLNSKDDAVRSRAAKLLSVPATGERQKAYEEAKASLGLASIPANGHEVFKRACASCHRLDQEGASVGPDLFDIRNQPKESILLHIVIPEQEIHPNFMAYTCETRDGRSITGLLVAELAAGVTLRQAQGVEESIARNNIRSMTANDVSFMPQELEKAMTRQELADLLAYLKGER